MRIFTININKNYVNCDYYILLNTYFQLKYSYLEAMSNAYYKSIEISRFLKNLNHCREKLPNIFLVKTKSVD